MSKRSVLVLTTMLVASVAINVVLAHKLRAVNRLVGGASDRLLRIGAIVLPFKAIDLRGQTVTVDYAEDPRPTVLYIFTPPCSWCARNMESFKTLLDKEGGQYRLIGISLSE